MQRFHMDTAKEISKNKERIAIWAITPNGLRLARKIDTALPGSTRFLSRRLCQKDVDSCCPSSSGSVRYFDELKGTLAYEFNNFDVHIFIFATGIAVRMISPLLKSKLVDPAVVVVDEKGYHAISLVSGHIGGANEITWRLANKINAIPVITTATDVNHLPSIDLIAVNNNLHIENPGAIKYVNMKILKGIPLKIFDPEQRIVHLLPRDLIDQKEDSSDASDIVCSWKIGEVSRETLILRPKILSLGIGCNRGTPFEDIKLFLTQMAEQENFSLLSVNWIGTTEVKSDETGILQLGTDLGLDIIFYSKDQLNSVESIENPSKMAEKYLGVRSVCEAAAILATQNGQLIMPKQKTKDVTLAVAKKV